MSGTREGGLKSAAKRLERDPNTFNKMGIAGGKKRHEMSDEQKKDIVARATQTRLANEPDAFKIMSAKSKESRKRNKAEREAEKEAQNEV